MGSSPSLSNSVAHPASVSTTLANGVSRRNYVQKIIMVIFVGLMLNAATACSVLRYETQEGTKVTYTRLFTTADKIKAEVGAAKVEVNKQKIDTKTIEAVLKALGLME